MKHNGFGYDCGAAIGAKLAEDLTALSLEIRAGLPSERYFGRRAKASPDCFAFSPIPCFY